MYAGRKAGVKCSVSQSQRSYPAYIPFVCAESRNVQRGQSPIGDDSTEVLRTCRRAQLPTVPNGLAIRVGEANLAIVSNGYSPLMIRYLVGPPPDIGDP